MKAQRGQSMTEFLVAMALLLPLALGVIYVGKYQDIKHQAIQASRYAAFERALDPSASHEPDAVLAEETRARFFTDGSRNNGKLGYQDTTASLATASSLNPLWSQLDASPMISQYSDVSVTLNQGSLNGPLNKTLSFAGQMYSLHSDRLLTSNVEVSPANIAGFAPLSNINLKIGATTVVLADAWNGGGKDNIAGNFTTLAFPLNLATGGTLKPLMQGLDKLKIFDVLAGAPAPQIDCVNPDAVPPDHLSQYTQQPACTNP